MARQNFPDADIPFGQVAVFDVSLGIRYRRINVIHYQKFGKIYGVEQEDIKVNINSQTFGGHGGGDEKMMEDIVKAFRGDGDALGLTTIDKSVMSHIMGFAAEESRLCDGKAVKI